MGLLLYLILFYGIYRLAGKALRFEKVTRFEQSTVPAYAMVMFLLTMSWTSKEIIVLAVLAVLSAGIGWFQASQLEVKHTSEHDRHGRPIILIKKNWPYLAGWVAVFVLGVATEIWHVGEVSSGEVIKKLAVEVRGELFSFMQFGHSYSWYIWAISAVSSLMFSRTLRQKDELISEAIKRPDRGQHKGLK